MNQRYKSDGSNVWVYDEFDQRKRRDIESDIDKTLTQENVIETLGNILDKEENALEQRENLHQKRIQRIKNFFIIAGLLTVFITLILTMFPFHIVTAIVLAPAMSFVLTGSTVSLVSFLTEKIEYKQEKANILQKILYCQRRKDMEMICLEEIKEEKRGELEPVKREANLYYRDTVREVERDVKDYSTDIIVPKKLVRSKKKDFSLSE